MKKSKVWYRNDNPEKGKVFVWKYIERVVHHEETYSWIVWKRYKWKVVPDNSGDYRLGIAFWYMGK